MPLVRLDVPDHLEPARVAGLAEAVQAALVATAGVPAAMLTSAIFSCRT